MNDYTFPCILRFQNIFMEIGKILTVKIKNMATALVVFSVCNQSLVVLIETKESNMNTIQTQLSKSINLLEARIVFQLFFFYLLLISCFLILINHW